MRSSIVAGNWKMNASKESVNALIADILLDVVDIGSKIIVCVPYPYLSQVEVLTARSHLKLGAQNLNINAEGAFTGEVSANMIKDFAVQYVIVGHSERRTLYAETNEIVAKKVKVALDNNLIPIFCIGESLAERELNNAQAVVSKQLKLVIDYVGVDSFRNVIIAYEPVWAIGTGVTATPKQAQEMHAFIRSVLVEYNADMAQMISILYGGSMNPVNASELIACEDIDGGLIGGASLKAVDFLQICRAG